MRIPKLGFLPLYVELYDRSNPENRPLVEAFRVRTIERLKMRGLEVIAAPICCLAKEFASAIEEFEKEDVDAVVTLHLAYSPSLESEQALAQLTVPVIVLDTTPDYVYDNQTDPGILMGNHGIHGVQDMCNLLRRHDKKFVVYAGHMDHSDVLERVTDAAVAAMMAHAFRSARVGRVGEPFAGMGDFMLPAGELERDLGIQTIFYDFTEGARRIKDVTAQELEAEYLAAQQDFIMSPGLTREIFDRSAAVGLAIRKWAAKERLSAFTINFMATKGSNPGLPVMPFVECSKAMARGTGYAGEGDVLTAALCGALLTGHEDATFAEMFCPNWRDDSVFLSHMGEFNYKSADGRPVLEEKPFPFTDAENPTVAYRSMKPGRTVLVNLAPFGNGRYALTLIPGEMRKVEEPNTMEHMVNGWFRPDLPLAECLERLSQAGGTHHSVMVYGNCLNELSCFAEFLGIEKQILR